MQACAALASCVSGLPEEVGSQEQPNFFNPRLTVIVPGGVGGRVLSTPGGINCPGDCTEVYGPGQTVNLQVLPADR